MNRSASLLTGIAVAAALTAGAAAPVLAGQPCLDGSPLAEVRPGTGVADKTGRWIGRVDSVHCRRGFRDARVFVRVGRLRDQTRKIFPARRLRMVGPSLVVPLTRAEIDRTPSLPLPSQGA